MRHAQIPKGHSHVLAILDTAEMEQIVRTSMSAQPILTIVMIMLHVLTTMARSHVHVILDTVEMVHIVRT